MGKPAHLKTCAYNGCSQEFRAQLRQIYCSRGCSGKATGKQRAVTRMARNNNTRGKPRQPARVCLAPGCGTTFVRHNYVKEYCSRECANRSTAPVRIAKRNATIAAQARPRSRGFGPFNCERCGNEFWRKSQREHKYCSLRCRTERSYLDFPEVACKHCGATVSHRSSNVRCKQFCNNVCYAAFQRSTRITKTCPCGREFVVQPSHDRIYCTVFCYHTIRQQLAPPTSIERRLYSALDILRLPYKPQKPIGKFLVDAWLPGHRIAIEADGTYWHSLPDRIERDKRLEDFAERRGFSLIRLPESLIMSMDVHGLAKHLEPLVSAATNAA